MLTKRIPKLLIIFLFVQLSCSKTEDNVPLNPPAEEINVENLVRKASLKNQDIPFKLVTENGEDATDLATFYVNGNAIEGNIFNTTDAGEYEVYAIYTDTNGVEVTTNTESFNVIVPKRKVIIEDYTGTWCGFCPRLMTPINELKEQNSDIVVVKIHETTPNFEDPMHFPEVSQLKEMFNVDGFPAGRLNRTQNWGIPHNTSDVTSMAGLDTDLAISINSETNGNSILVQVNVVYANGSQLGDKLVVYLVEDGIISDQVNYYNQDATSPFYQLGDPIPNFVHNDALRANLTGLFGNAIPETPALEEHIASYNYNIPSNYVKDNLKIVAMVVDEDNNGKNVQYAKLDELKPYE